MHDIFSTLVTLNTIEPDSVWGSVAEWTFHDDLYEVVSVSGEGDQANVSASLNLQGLSASDAVDLARMLLSAAEVVNARQER